MNRQERATIITHALAELEAIQQGSAGPLGRALLKTWFPLSKRHPQGFRSYPPAYCADVLERIRSALRTPEKWQILPTGEAIRRMSANPSKSYADLEPR